MEGNAVNDLQSRRKFLHSTWDKELFEQSPQTRGEAQPAAETAAQESALIALPDPALAEMRERDITEVIRNRKTVRRLGGREISVEALSYLLWATNGLRKEKNGRLFRTVPSGGCCHPLDTYLYADRVSGLPQGLYRFVCSKHALVSVKPGSEQKEVLNEALNNHMFHSAVSLFWVAIPARGEWRYTVEAAKMIALDAGHIAQNGYLAAQALGMGCCAVAAYDQRKLDEALELDGDEAFAVYTAMFGFPPPREG